MVEIGVDSKGLRVSITGWDAWLCTLKRRWEFFVPLQHVNRGFVGKRAGFAVRRHIAGKGGTIRCPAFRPDPGD